MLGTKSSSFVKFASLVFLSCAISLWSACGGGMNVGASASTSNGVTVAPAGNSVRVGDTAQFSAIVTGNNNQAVTWSVNGMAGGNATVGTIDATGLYHSPAVLPKPNSVTVEAVSVADKTLNGNVSVTLQNPVPVPQKVSPDFVLVGNFSLSVTGTKFVSGAKVMFGGTPLTTTFVSATQLTATGTSTAAQKGTVKTHGRESRPWQDRFQRLVERACRRRRVKVQVLVIPATTQMHRGRHVRRSTAA